MQRWPIAALAGLVLALSSLTRAAECAPPEAGAFDSWVGTWTSGDDGPADPLIAKLIVEAHGSEVAIHVWARCAPADCDWGTVTAQSYRRRGSVRRLPV